MRVKNGGHQDNGTVAGERVIWRPADTAKTRSRQRCAIG